MKIAYLGPELETHRMIVELILKQLNNRGHQTIIKIWHYGREEQEINFAGIVADVYVLCSNYKALEKTIDQIDTILVHISHGISPYKPWGTHIFKRGHRVRFVPTFRWKLHSGDKDNSFITPVDGWCKLDLYHKALQNKEETKKYIYNKYQFDPARPLIVYAPTGMRFNAQTKERWIAEYGNDKGYGWHGSYYHKDVVRKITNKIANYYEIPHPTISRQDDIVDRVPILAISDIMIGDISSMSLEYTAVDKPIILLKKDIQDSDPKDYRLFGKLENPIVDLGDIISINELEEVLQYRLYHDDYKTIRNYWKNELLGTVDGNCALREAEAIESFAKKYSVV